MYSLRKSSLVIITIFIFSFCSKRKDSAGIDGPDRTPPTITIISPNHNQVFTSGQTINVSANATDNVKVTELHIHIINTTTEAVLRDVHSYPGNKNGTVQDAFIAQLGFKYTIKIIAIDAAQNPITAQVVIAVN